MALEPLKSAISIRNVDDTSLALPSLNQYRSGQQRVLEQVQTIRRTKSRHSRVGSCPVSPTSPVDNVFTYSFKSIPTTFTESGNGLHKTLGQDKSTSWQMGNSFKGSTIRNNASASTSHYDRGYVSGSTMAFGKNNTSRSEPDFGGRFVKPKPAVPSQRLQSNSYNTFRTGRSQSQFLPHGQPQPQPQPSFNMNGSSQTKKNSQFIASRTEMSKAPTKHFIVESPTRTKGDSGLNGNSGSADITMKEAVQFLSHYDEATQHCGASFIQHNTFIDDKAKQEVLKMNGVPPLVALLHSPSVRVSHTASAALRNLSFKDNANKEEVQRCGGIEEAVALLRETDSSDTQKQLTGLLWNLSSVDNLKPDLLKTALPVLMERVILPYTTAPDRAVNNSIDPEVFFHATGCLRNISSTKQSNRQAMRKYRGLVDSLVSYVHDCVEAGRPDDKSVENCACILHNLTFQLEAEAPALFSRITALSGMANRAHSQADTGPIGCFSSQSSKVLEQERHFDYPVVEETSPKGAGWLIHSKTLQSYLSLLSSSQRDDTLEACCGTLQNLTVNPGIVSSVMSQTIVQKLNGMQVITPLLKSSKVNLQKNTVSLVGNLAKNSRLHTGLARKALPELVGLLTSRTEDGNESDDTISVACQTAHCLMFKEPELSKGLINKNLVNSLNNLSQNRYFPKSSKAASLFLYNLWSDKEMQSFVKRQALNKTSFVNDITTAAYKSVQVVE